MQYILTVKMHCNNEQFTTQCTDVPVRGTRNIIQKKLMQRVVEKDVVDATERDVAVEQYVNLQSRNLKVQEATARESILSGRKKREPTTVKNQQSWLKIPQASREFLSRSMQSKLMKTK